MKKNILLGIFSSIILVFSLMTLDFKPDNANADPVMIRGAENFSRCTGNDVPDNCDICPTESGYHVDNLPDVDSDGVPDDCDICAANQGVGGNGSGFDGIDNDGDGVPDDCDNCPLISNPAQEDSNGFDDIAFTQGDDCEPQDCLGVVGGTTVEDTCGCPGRSDYPGADLGCGCGLPADQGCGCGVIPNECGSCPDDASIIVEDLCGECDGDNSSCADCLGVPNGTAVEDPICGCDKPEPDACGRCEGDAGYDANTSSANNNGNDIPDACEPDCSGVMGGDDFTCVDCLGVLNGTAVDNGCGCNLPGPSGCDNECGSTKVDDACGDCGGDGSGCADCLGVSNGTAVVDPICGCDKPAPDACGRCEGTAGYDPSVSSADYTGSGTPDQCECPDAMFRSCQDLVTAQEEAQFNAQGCGVCADYGSCDCANDQDSDGQPDDCNGCPTDIFGLGIIKSGSWGLDSYKLARSSRIGH